MIRKVPAVLRAVRGSGHTVEGCAIDEKGPLGLLAYRTPLSRWVDSRYV